MIRVSNPMIIMESVWEDAEIIKEDHGLTYHDFVWFELLKEVVSNRGNCRRQYRKLSDICPKYNNAYSWPHPSSWHVHEQGNCGLHWGDDIGNYGHSKKKRTLCINM